MKNVFILSHVTYNYGLILPIKEIIKIIRKKLKDRAIIIIDGAHAFTSIPINIKSINPDLYVFDLYKWANGLEGQGVCVIKNRLFKRYNGGFSTIYGSIDNLLKRTKS